MKARRFVLVLYPTWSYQLRYAVRDPAEWRMKNVSLEGSVGPAENITPARRNALSRGQRLYSPGQTTPVGKQTP